MKKVSSGRIIDRWGQPAKWHCWWQFWRRKPGPNWWQTTLGEPSVVKWEYCELIWLQGRSSKEAISALGYSDRVFLSGPPIDELDRLQGFVSLGRLWGSADFQSREFHNVEDMQATLQELGAQGWELVSTTVVAQSPVEWVKTFYFKRPLP
jgi:hypothetical protein